MPGRNHLKKIYIAAAVLCAMLLILSAWLAWDLHSLYHRGIFSRHMSRSMQIEDWMTFRYVNRVFNLPPDYLRENLSISSQYYPNIVIGTYALSHQLDSREFLSQIQQAVTDYSAGGNR